MTTGHDRGAPPPDIIKEWPEFDVMLQKLEDLGTLGLSARSAT
jgi:hypothetical protein